MLSDAPIGRVVCVSGTQIVATLAVPHPDRAGETRVEKGSIVKIPLTRSVVFCMVSGLSVPVPGQPAGGSETRLAELELLGESPIATEGQLLAFRRGICTYPALGDCLHLVREEDLDCIFARHEHPAVHLGTLHHASGRALSISPDTLLSKHFAVLGTTGSGKSCAVTAVLRSLLDAHAHGHVVLLDPHNEYKAAFGDRAVLLGPDALQLPYWMLSGEEICGIVADADRASGHVEAALSILQELILLAKRAHPPARDDSSLATVDTPVPYRLGDLDRMIDDAMGRLDKPEALAPYRWLKGRLASLRRDSRYAFMFGGISVQDNMARILSTIFRVPPDGKPITIIDLSSVPGETLNVVVSVLLRLAFDFALWSGGAVPILLVCEEAHRYAPGTPGAAFASTRQMLARIAKEGRKYGLSLGIVSQRPSELDASVLSQCNTVFALRMTNLRDQEFVRGILTDDASGLLDFLPALGDAEAIVAGQAVPVPLRLRFPELPPEHRPRSPAASFSHAWSNARQDADFVHEVVRLWRRQFR